CTLLLIAAAAMGALVDVRRLLVPAVGLRIIGEIGASMLFNAALLRMPIANAGAILQFIPLVTTAVAARLFGEKVGWQRWLMGAVGFVGVLFVLKPGAEGFNAWSLLAVGSMLSMCLRDLATSRIPPTLPTLTIAALTAGCAGLAGCLLFPFETWIMPSPRAAGFVVLAGVMMAFGFICLVVGMRSADMSLLAPFRYASVLWAILIGYLVWNEMIDGVAAIGIALVVGAGLATLFRERTVVRRRIAGRSARGS
ncbi:MAG TPA: DMT family transporter, partial [Hyphomicrobiaceae bacterium]|nr:DMT family transporter [Hyphomicrobiaceae bacterium]